MNRIPTLVRTAAAILFAVTCVVLCGPGSVRNIVTLEWDAYDWGGETNYCGFTLYEQSGTNWVAVASAGRMATQVALTNVVPGIHTYALTASNYWGESYLSNPASTPKVTGKPVNLHLGN